MVRYLRLCYPCCMRLDLFYRYSIEHGDEPAEHLQQRLMIAEEGIGYCSRKEGQCWSLFRERLVQLWQEHVKDLKKGKEGY